MTWKASSSFHVAKIHIIPQKALGKTRKVSAEGLSLYIGKGLLPVGDGAANHRQGLGSDVEERGDGIKRQVFHDTWTTAQ